MTQNMLAVEAVCDSGTTSRRRPGCEKSLEKVPRRLYTSCPPSRMLTLGRYMREDTGQVPEDGRSEDEWKRLSLSRSLISRIAAPVLRHASANMMVFLSIAGYPGREGRMFRKDRSNVSGSEARALHRTMR